MTSANDIVNLMSRFNSSIPFTDAPNGFYGILNQTFENLKKEEERAADWEGGEVVDYPGFGSKEDGYEDVVRPFYRTWINFSTKKSFSWRDAYRASDAPDRATRRLIEKENKRLREEGIREFNDAVRALVAFVRKRDRRYIPNSQTEADRQKILRDAAVAQAAKSRAANQAKFEQHVVPDWAKTQEPDQDNVGGFSDSEEEVVEEIECVVCGKTFKSEKQFETHERSKKHVKAVQELQREMRRENEALNLDKSSAEDEDDPISDLDELDIHDQEEPPVESSIVLESVDDIEASIPSIPEAKDENKPPSSGKKILDASPSSSDQDDDEYASRKTVESRLTNSLHLEDVDSTPAASDGDVGQKLGKAKLKRAKRAAKQEQFVQESQEAQFRCTTCSESFPSKTKLFAHIEQFPKHAQLAWKSAAKQGKGKKKK
jgi:DnaJ family protein A protein 5